MTVTPLIDTRRKRDLYPVVVRIRHGSQTREIGTGYKIPEKNWKKNQVVGHPDAGKINKKIADLINEARTYYEDCERKHKHFRVDLIGKGHHSYSFNEYLVHRAGQYAKKEMLIMETKTKRIEKELKNCFGREIYFDEVNQDLLRDYEAWLMKQGNTNNTRHKKFKFLQQFYTQAVNDDKATDPNPFKLYKIVIKPVQKEKLSLQEIKAIENLKLKPGAVNDARNLFLFSYYCKGARFENCITFKRSQIVKDRLVFRTNKGNKFISVQVHSRLEHIIKSYPGKSEFLFPFVKELPEDKKKYIRVVDVVNVIVNRNLKIIAHLCKIKPFTFHQARHTFAFHLKKVANNISVISDSLGHSSVRTTEIYLKALDDEFLDSEMRKLYGD